MLGRSRLPRNPSLHRSLPRPLSGSPARTAVLVLALAASLALPLPALGQEAGSPAAGTPAAGTSPARYVPQGWPGPGTTGAEGRLRDRGPMTITRDGRVIRNVRVHGQITIHADNVTLRNVHVSPQGASYGVLVYGKGASIERSTVDGAGGSLAGIASTEGGQFVASRVTVLGTEDGVRLGNRSVLRHSLIHRLAGDSSSHYDAVTADGYHRWRIRHNTILNPHGQTAAVWVGDDRYGPSAGVMRNNYLAGGGYSVYAGPGSGKGIRVLDNAFSTRYFRRSGSYGPVYEWHRANNTWTGNRWVDGPQKGRRVRP